jgi:CheY-like chemotaxis protein
MPDTVKSSFAKQMAPLRERYLHDLSSRCDELKSHLGRLQASGLTPPVSEPLALLAHSLAGSGATYGFPDLSKKARLVENSLSPELVDLHQVIVNLVELIASCESLLKRPHKVSLHDLVAAQPMASKELATVLVVDDNPEIRRLFATLLADFATVLGARTASEAMAVMAKSRPDLVLLDDEMPGGISGTAMLEELRFNPAFRSLPVIMVTANNDAGRINRIMKSGVIDYIVKPFQPRHAMERIKSHLQRLRTSVLVVDDDIAIRLLLGTAFDDAGMHSRLAENGSEALAMMKDIAPDLVLLDYLMPGMSGVDVLQVMNEDPALAHIPVVFLTGKNDVTDVTRALKLGAVDYIVKPCSPQKVVRRCLQIVEQRGAGKRAVLADR